MIGAVGLVFDVYSGITDFFRVTIGFMPFFQIIMLLSVYELL